MRLTPDEVAAIKECAARHFGEGAVVRLFGSRTNDTARGGDIDLHIVADSEDKATLSSESRFLDALEPRIGERRVDVILRAPKEPLEPIDRIAIATGIPL